MRRDISTRLRKHLARVGLTVYESPLGSCFRVVCHRSRAEQAVLWHDNCADEAKADYCFKLIWADIGEALVARRLALREAPKNVYWFDGEVI